MSFHVMPTPHPICNMSFNLGSDGWHFEFKQLLDPNRFEVVVAQLVIMSGLFRPKCLRGNYIHYLIFDIISRITLSSILFNMYWQKYSKKKIHVNHLTHIE